MGVGFTLRPQVDPDLWGHLRFGQYFLEVGLPPQPDIFSYASTETWIDHEWLCEILYFLAWRSMGDFGYYLVKAVAGMIVAVVLLYHANRVSASGAPSAGCARVSDAGRRTDSLLATAIVFCTAFICLGNGMLLRPQLFTYLLTACLMHIYLMNRDGKSGWLYACPVIMALWSNLHAGVVAGIGLMVIFCVGDAIEGRRPLRLTVALLYSLAATLITPYGADYWTFLLHATTLGREYITEWAPLTWKFENGAYLLCAMVFSFAFVRSRLQKTPTEILIFIVTLYLGLTHMRHMMLFAITTGMTIAPHVADCLPVRLKARTGATDLSPRDSTVLRVVYFVAAVSILSAMGVAVAHKGLGVAVDPNSYPVAATRFIRENRISGNIYPTFNWGQYAIWHLHPQCRVGADGRYETVYSREHEKIQMAFDVGMLGWEDVVDTWPTDIVLCPNKYHFRLAMDSRPEWAKVYEDTAARVYLKRVPKFAGVIDRAGRNELIQPRASSLEYFP